VRSFRMEPDVRGAGRKKRDGFFPAPAGGTRSLSADGERPASLCGTDAARPAPRHVCGPAGREPHSTPAGLAVTADPVESFPASDAHVPRWKWRGGERAGAADLAIRRPSASAEAIITRVAFARGQRTPSVEALAGGRPCCGTAREVVADLSRFDVATDRAKRLKHATWTERQVNHRRWC
jgi:hypothetical protein